MNKSILFLLLIFTPIVLKAQQGTLSGDLQTNINFFQKDTAIQASGNPLYENYLSGNESWLSLRYNVSGWTFSIRADAFTNSNLYNPNQALTLQGIGAYTISKEMNDLTIVAGYIYDQIGSGLLFRSYEDRGLLIDNSLVGLELKYKLGKNIQLKGLTGQQKFLLSKYSPVIRAFNAEGDYSIGKAHVIPGIGVLNRTLDQESIFQVASNVNNLDVTKRFSPRWNMYAFSLYNTLTWNTISWYAEGAYKTHEAIINAEGTLIDTAGTAFFTTLNYAKKGFALNLSAKRTENFVMRTSPNQVLLNGMLNWQPIVARLRPQRVMSRYSPPSQDISELAVSVDGLYTPNDNLSLTGTYTYIDKLDKTRLYREIFTEAVYTGFSSWILEGGLQYMEYNQRVYQINPNANVIYAITPFAEITYKLNQSNSLRFEAQYMDTKQDFGSWLFLLMEYNLSPKFSISVSDMYNIDPNYSNSLVTKANHYYSVYSAFTKGPHRFSLAYVKQVAGINCTGGVCRFEPAFSGIRSTFSTSF